MKKEKVILGIILIVILGVIIFGVYKYFNKKEVVDTKTDAEKFALEYTKVPDDNVFVYRNIDEIINILEHGTGVVYLGFPECPWCRNAVPILLGAAEESGIKQIYYLNNHDDRDTKVLKDGEVITENEGTSNYNKLLEKLGDKASVYEGLEDKAIKRLYYPTVVFVKNGEITDYIEGTVESQEDPYTPLTKNQRQELKDKYKSAISNLLNCDQDSKC